MNGELAGGLAILGLVVSVAAVGLAVYMMHRADEAVASARRAVRAAEAARRRCDGLIELLAELSPSARRAWLATRDHRPPVTALVQRRFAQQHGHRIDEGTT